MVLSFNLVHNLKMAKLIYHSLLDAPSTGASPFDDAVLQVARSGPVRIVSPYIGVAYLERATSLSGEWRLISDVQEWLRSLSVRARPRAWGFIRENIDKIHHCTAVHAKAIISDSLAMMGSANFTSQGILGRTELGVLLDNPALVAELGAWFEDLWRRTTPPLVDEASAFVQWLDEEAAKAPAHRQTLALSGANRLVRAKLVSLQETHAPRAEGEPLSLGAIAQDLVVQEQEHYDSIGQAIEAAIDKLTRQGSFVLGDVVRQVRAGFESASPREIYLLLIQHCANHVRTVFAESTRNRLTLSDGRFTQSEKETLTGALARFDNFLAYLIEKLHFDFTQALPLEAVIEAKTDIRGQGQVMLVAELAECGFLDVEDVAGELPRYQLAEDFPWEPRYQLFAQAHRKWLAKKAAPREPHRVTIEAGEGYDGYALADASLAKESGFFDSPASLPSSPTVTRQDRAQIEQDKKARVDAALAHILRKILAGKTLKATSAKQLAEKIHRESVFGLRAGRMTLQHALENRDQRWPRVFVFQPDHVVVLNPQLTWEELEGFPALREACTAFLGRGQSEPAV